MASGTDLPEEDDQLAEEISLRDQAFTAFEEDDWETAIRLADKALAAKDDDPHVLLVKAGAHAQLDQFDQFLTAVDGAIAVAPDDPDPLVVKALVLLGREDVAGALEAAERATKVDPDDADAWDAMAEALLVASRYSEAVQAAQTAVSLPDATTEHRLTLARAASVNDEPSLALEALDEVLEQDPNNSKALIGKGWELLGEEDTEARALIDRAYELDPTSPFVLRAKGLSLGISGEFEAAAATFRDLLDVSPDSAEGWLGLGLSYRSNNQPDRALNAYRRARELDPNSAIVNRNLGEVLLDLEDYAGALQKFTELVETEPKSSINWYSKGITERHLGFFDDSIESLRVALSLDGFEDSEDWGELARSYSAAGQHENAWRAFREAFRFSPHEVDLAIGIAVESVWGHHDARALQELLDAEERCGTSALIEFNRGVAHHRLGREAEACDAWRRAHQLDPDLTAAEVLVASFTTQTRLGGWADHWFGERAGLERKFGGAALLFALVLFLAVPALEPDLLPGIVTGTISLTAYIPAFVLLFLLVLPTIRGLAVGGVQLDVSPLPSPDQPQHPINPDQILPMLKADDLDIRRLIQR